ncbi:MAG: MoxR family ATPase [SAR324 cluster bacterium]|nr:MoxR family ATPase [SAR324 cluster bacterium]MCZ6533238.1 MoxR family ATPase [SAR324 cluster bacterium]MCZ6557375.1 MoxR family ATPase [SAR324 cluster bacterium]MCZ6647144.1 MoxR family ATPase [SAR324 cluster bacterium]MCZ6730107.1 MoxR family ATPase [SAR324 cluster bacterium]
MNSESAKTIANQFVDLRKEMDKFVVGHETVKTGLILGMMSREHIYIEGPPGMAKTMLAEIVAAASNLKFYLYQFHRDTRLAELVGDVVIQRERDGDNGELIVQSIRKGGVLTAEICVLDDISRAPGEALNVLLRILNERQFQTDPIPLLTAIATSNPTVDDYYNEPLDPANLDRFTIQIRSSGLIQENQWDQVQEVINLYSDSEFSDEVKPQAMLSRKVFDNAYEVLHKVTVPDLVKRCLIDLLSRFVNQFKLDPSNSLITDRSFLVKTIKVLKAQALLSGRIEVVPDDLNILSFMTTFRVPEEINRSMPALVAETIQRVAS